MARKLNPPDNTIEDLLRKIENTEPGNKVLKNLWIFGAFPGNKVKINWTDNTSAEFIITNDLQPEGNIQIVILPGIKHEEWILVLTQFQEKYGRLPTLNDLNKLKNILENDIRKRGAGKSSQEVVIAHDPNIKYGPEGNVLLGQKMNYKIEYENEGEGIAFGVYFTDTLDEDLDESALQIGPVVSTKDGSVIAPAGTYNPLTRTITWFVGEVGPKEGGCAEFSMNVKTYAPEGSEVINFATVYFPSALEAICTNGIVNKIVTTLDNIAPSTSSIISPLPNSQGWNKEDVTVNLTATDNSEGTGVKEIHYKLTGAVQDEQVIQGGAATITVSNEGITTLTYYAIDNKGNIEWPESLELKLDKTPPDITAVVSLPPNSFGWHNSDVMVDFTVADTLSGIAGVTPSQIVTSEGEGQDIGGEAIDIADNKAATYVTLNIDKTKPAISIISPEENKEYFHAESIPLNCVLSENLSQIDYSSFTLDGVPLIDTATIRTVVGNHILSVTATDRAGNRAALERHFTVKLKADVTIKPEVFLLNRGVFLAFVKFPEGYDAGTINDATCDGAQAKKIIPMHNLAIIIFRKDDITAIPIDATFTVRGHFDNGLLFEGSDNIKKVINKSLIFGRVFDMIQDREAEEIELDKAIDEAYSHNGGYQDSGWLKRNIRELNR